MKVVAGILVVVVGILVWALYSLREARQQMAAQQQSNEVIILDFSNRWETTRRSLDEQKRVNEVLETNLTDRARALESSKVEIAGLTTDLAKSRAETKTAQDEIVKRDAQINTLENRNVDLTKQMGDLQSAITGLEEQITAAERKLAASEGNRQELLKELQHLQNEKIAMEKQLNDLAFVRDQVRKLKEELTVARRLDWIRRGIYSSGSRKGGEALVSGRPAAKEPAKAEGASGSGLEVELRTSGEVKVSTSTNAPANPK